MNIPDKCMSCPHTVTRFERVCVKSSWQIDYVIRCGLDPLQHKVGCVAAEVHCKYNGYKNSYDEPPSHACLCEVIDHAGNRFKSRYYKNDLGTWVWDTTKSRGYDICFWREIEDLKVKESERK